MSYVQSNQNIYGAYARDYTEEQLETMTTKQFDKLPLADQVNIYNKHRDVYDRLTGRVEKPKVEDARSDSQKFCDEFEARVFDIIERNFHPNGR